MRSQAQIDADLALLSAAVRLASRAEALKAAATLVQGFASPSLSRKLIEAATLAEDAARVGVNRLRVVLGGDPLPDPADPPPARPDD